MPEPSAPRPTGRKPAAPPPTARKVPGPGSSSQVPRPVSTVPTKRMPTAAPPPSQPEIVVSSDGGEEEELSTVRQKVSGPSRRARGGLSLRWKIVASMAGITVATAILIFTVVYSKAVGQLNDEINYKGVRLVKTLASVDASYWHQAIYQADRVTRLDALLGTAFGGKWGESTRRQLDRPGTPYTQLLKPQESSQRALESLAQYLEETLEGRQKETFQKQYRAAFENPTFKEKFRAIVDPVGEALKPFKNDTGNVGPGSDILEIMVKDANSENRVEAVGGQFETLMLSKASRSQLLDVGISDGRDNKGTEVRRYVLEKPLNAAKPGGDKLEFSVILSLKEINEAKGSLRMTILLPVFISVLLGTGIAVWISTLITEPIKMLQRDINQVSSGNLEHQTVARSRDEIGELASAFNRMTSALREAHHSEIEAKAMEHDLAIASEIQSNLVPKRMLKIPGFDIGAYYRPSKEVGGDYYDFIEITEDLEGIIVADVSGKGIPGSLVMSMARAFIRMEAERWHNTSPGDTLGKANRMLAQDIKKGMFVTALYCILNKQTNECIVASAGHNPLVVWRAAENKVELVNPNGIALGFDKGPVFEKTVKEERVVLNHGDRIVMFTDGTVEAMSPSNKEFGDDRFYELIQKLATRDSNQMLNLVVKALDEHKGSAPQSDDITIVTLRYL